MDHFPPSNWIDLARGVLPASQTAAIQNHLGESCAECLQSAETWHHVFQVTAREPAYQPPVDTVRIVKAAYAGERPKHWFGGIVNFARLVFDNVTQPIPALVRAASHSSRQVVHEAEPFVIDLRLQSDPARKRITLVGQVLNSKNPQQAVSGVDIVLLSDHQLVKQTLANSLGEFDLDFGPEPNLQLLINIRGQRAIGLMLPELNA